MRTVHPMRMPWIKKEHGEFPGEETAVMVKGNLKISHRLASVEQWVCSGRKLLPVLQLDWLLWLEHQ